MPPQRTVKRAINPKEHHQPSTKIPENKKGTAAAEDVSEGIVEEGKKMAKQVVTKTKPIKKPKEMEGPYEPLLEDDGSYASDTYGRPAKELAGKGETPAKDKDLNKSGKKTKWNS